MLGSSRGYDFSRTLRPSCVIKKVQTTLDLLCFLVQSLPGLVTFLLQNLHDSVDRRLNLFIPSWDCGGISLLPNP